MEEKIITKGTYSFAAKCLPIIMLIIGIILVPNGWDGGSFGNRGTEYYFMFCAGIALIIGAIVLLFYIGNCELTVSDVRVYGKAAFGKRVDLPMDSVSAISTTLFSGIAVATSSGKVCFLGLKNTKEIHKELSALIIKRQREGSAQQVVMPQSSAEELKKYKELLDSGIISQEEFDAKKKQLLGV